MTTRSSEWLEFAGDLQAVPLLAVERRQAEQFEHPQNAVHRRADFVAHRREEVAFGLVGGGGRGLRLLDEVE